jgi:hypothetical protein
MFREWMWKKIKKIVHNLEAHPSISNPIGTNFSLSKWNHKSFNANFGLTQISFLLKPQIQLKHWAKLFKMKTFPAPETTCRILKTENSNPQSKCKQNELFECQIKLYSKYDDVAFWNEIQVGILQCIWNGIFYLNLFTFNNFVGGIGNSCDKLITVGNRSLV